jgi:predicted phage replisome organizer
VLAGKTNSEGCIFLAENIPYTDEMLSAIFNRQLNVVRLALDTFRKFNMIDILDNNYILISNWGKHQNIDKLEKMKEQTRQRVEKHRTKKREIVAPAEQEICGSNVETCNDVCNVTVTLRNALEVEEEVEVDKEEDITTTATRKTDADYIKFFNNNMGHLMTPHEYQLLKSYIEDGMSPEVITLALEEAVEADARDIRYIRTILNRWLEHGLKTIESVEADKRNFKDKQKKKQTPVQVKTAGKANNFNNFEQRRFDKSVEEQLLQQSAGEEVEDPEELLKQIRGK